MFHLDLHMIVHRCVNWIKLYTYTLSLFYKKSNAKHGLKWSVAEILSVKQILCWLNIQQSMRKIQLQIDSWYHNDKRKCLLKAWSEIKCLTYLSVSVYDHVLETLSFCFAMSEVISVSLIRTAHSFMNQLGYLIV